MINSTPFMKRRKPQQAVFRLEPVLASCLTNDTLSDRSFLDRVHIAKRDNP
ncbi:hypothetical protein PVN23_03000 [Bacillus licheniformis]|uniref:hypothetical protein n=1 Tax=Bacillus licheniformis TaxID=1402 RepID=UPI00237CAD21|nr:hypothetical protein [Bacillus licheniformis]MDE1377617.1 hypothetical protein [Bacillus licheniformis]MDE1442796.1 hypothetical protein [Bacillus licheniformis]